MWRKLYRLVASRMTTPDFFALLCVAPDCELDRALLEQRYRAQQAQWHPDRFVNASDGERLAALQHTSLLNDAYATLKNPLKRAEHLLDVKCPADARQPALKLEHAFLMQQMELREELEALAERKSPEALQPLRQQVESGLTQYWQEFADEINKQDWCVARLGLQKLQFLHKLQEDINHLEDRWLDN